MADIDTVLICAIHSSSLFGKNPGLMALARTVHGSAHSRFQLPFRSCLMIYVSCCFSSHSSVTVLITICLLVQEPQNCEKCDKVPLKASFAENAATDLNSDSFQSKSPSSGCLHFRSRKTAKAETFCELAHRSKIFSCVGKGIPTQKL